MSVIKIRDSNGNFIPVPTVAGVGIASANINSDGNLILVKTDGTTINAGDITQMVLDALPVAENNNTEAIRALQSEAHTHENMEALNDITTEKVSAWDSVLLTTDDIIFNGGDAEIDITANN